MPRGVLLPGPLQPPAEPLARGRLLRGLRRQRGRRRARRRSRTLYFQAYYVPADMKDRGALRGVPGRLGAVPGTERRC
ncbi:MAG: hypothetical protein MZV64_72985 [Ignavibacteriales bacterium]|nr:hypothetical protein [Ignavibacteriales bacterium]